MFLILFASLNTHSSLVVCIFVIETSNLNKKCGDVDRRRTLLLNTSSGGSVLVSVALQSTLGFMCPVRLSCIQTDNVMSEGPLAVNGENLQ